MVGNKYFPRALLALNLVLLITIVTVLASRKLGFGKLETAELPAKGTRIAEIFGEDFSMAKEVLRTEARRIILMFHRDSSLARSVEYLHTFSRCVPSSPVKLVSFVVVCAPREKCENIGVFEFENIHEPFSVRFHSDEENTFLWRFGVHHSAMVIVDARSLEITASYGYLVNPFVLCELLEQEEKNAH